VARIAAGQTIERLSLEKDVLQGRRAPMCSKDSRKPYAFLELDTCSEKTLEGLGSQHWLTIRP
jgi:hypothetical protein